jgi:hypothetical protein
MHSAAAFTLVFDHTSYIFNNYNDNGIDVTYSCSFGKFQYFTPWSTVPLEKLTVSKLINKFLAICGTRRFITAFTSAHHLSLYYPPFYTWVFQVVYLFPSGFPNKTL